MLILNEDGLRIVRLLRKEACYLSLHTGSDKRELYTIAQPLQKTYHDLLFTAHRIIIRFNGWQGVHPEVPFIQLTTLDEHQDIKQIKRPNANNDNSNEAEYL